MRFTRTVGRALATVTMTAALAVTIAPAQALTTAASTDAVTVSTADELFFREKMRTYAVPAETQDALFEKLRAGQLWDADIEGAVPVSTETRATGGVSQTIERFADGSISAQSHEIPGRKKPGTTTNAWHGCSVVIGTTYNTASDCTVSWTRGTTYMQFSVDARIYHNGYDRLSNADNYFHRFIGGTVTSESASVTRSTETAAAAARASYKMNVDLYAGLGSRSYVLVLELSNGSFWHNADF